MARSKRALFGISIIVFYTILAVFAPFITPFDPSYDTFLANDHAVPEWYRTLGLENGLSGNVVLADRDVREFRTQSSLSAWTFKTSDDRIVYFNYSSTEGDAAPGSVAIYVAPRQAGSSYGKFDLTIERRFRYPYEGPPGRFVAAASLLIQIPGIDLVIIGDAPPARAPLKIDPAIRYVDSNSNDVWNPDETLVRDRNLNGVFDLLEEPIFGAAPATGRLLEADFKVRFYDFNGNNAQDGTEGIAYDTNGNALYNEPPSIEVNAYVEQDFQRMRYADSNNNNLWDQGETVAYDPDGNAAYSTGDFLLYGIMPAAGTLLKSDPKIRYIDSSGSNIWESDRAETVAYDTNDNGSYDSGEPIIYATLLPGTYLYIDPKVRYVDSDGSAVWDVGETVVTDVNNDSAYDAGDLLIFGSAPAPGTLLSTDSKIRYDDENGNDVRDTGEAVVYDTNDNGGVDSPDRTIFVRPPSAGLSLKVSKGTFTLWDKRYPTDGKFPPSWVSADPPMDSFSSAFKALYFGGEQSRPEAIVFTQQVEYTYRIRLTLNDADSTVPLNLALYVDDLNMNLLGTAYGLFGTDQQGRDLFSQLAYGARVSLAVGLIAAALGVVVGLFVGLLAGFKAGLTDEFLMRFTDMLLVLPGLPLLLVLVAVLKPGIWTIIGVLGFLGWMGFARVIRSQVVSLKERPFVEASKALGGGTPHIILRHIFPNVLGLTYISLATGVPGAITAEAALSFLGLFDPFLISWGRILYNAQNYEGFFLPWWILPPGISIALLSLSFILIGYALDDILNPRLRTRR